MVRQGAVIMASLAPWERPGLFDPGENRGLLGYWLGYDPAGAGDPDPYVWYHAVIRGRRRVWARLEPVPWTRHPAATAYWDEWLPDHCPGSLVVYPGAVLDAVDDEGNRYYVPAAVVACHHFEHGHSPGEWAALHEYARLLARELLASPDGDHDAVIALYDPHGDRLVLVVEAPYWYDPDYYYTGTPEEAMDRVARGWR